MNWIDLGLLSLGVLMGSFAGNWLVSAYRRWSCESSSTGWG